MVEDHLIKKAERMYEKYLQLTDEDVMKIFIMNRFPDKDDLEEGRPSIRMKTGLGTSFTDYSITNNLEEGDDTLAMFRVKTNYISGHEILPSRVLSKDCVLKEVEWRFSSTRSTKPVIEWLRLVKADGETVEMDCSRGDSSATASYSSATSGTDVFRLEGLLVITNFDISRSGITTLRLCGCNSVEEFIDTFEYYSLWQISSGGKEALEKCKK